MPLSRLSCQLSVIKLLFRGRLIDRRVNPVKFCDSSLDELLKSTYNPQWIFAISILGPIPSFLLQLTSPHPFNLEQISWVFRVNTSPEAHLDKVILFCWTFHSFQTSVSLPLAFNKKLPISLFSLTRRILGNRRVIGQNSEIIVNFATSQEDNNDSQRKSDPGYSSPKWIPNTNQSLMFLQRILTKCSGIESSSIFYSFQKYTQRRARRSLMLGSHHALPEKHKNQCRRFFTGNLSAWTVWSKAGETSQGEAHLFFITKVWRSYRTSSNLYYEEDDASSCHLSFKI